MEMPNGKMSRDACTNLHFTNRSLFQAAEGNLLNVTEHTFHFFKDLIFLQVFLSPF